MLLWSSHPFTDQYPPHSLTSPFGQILDATINNYSHALPTAQIRRNPTLCLFVPAHIPLKMLEKNIGLCCLFLLSWPQMPGGLRGIHKSDCISQTNYSWTVLRLPTLLPTSSCQQMNLLLISLRKWKQSEGVIHSPPSQGSNLPTGPRGSALTLIWQSICALNHILTPQLKDVLLAIVSSLSCLNFSQSAEGWRLGPSGQAPWLGCGSLPKKGGASGAPFALSD